MIVLSYEIPKGQVMNDKTPLKQWMDEKGYSYAQLAQELDFSYEYIYKIAKDDKRVTDSFRLRFLARFGWEEAQNVFDTEPLRALLEALPA